MKSTVSRALKTLGKKSMRAESLIDRDWYLERYTDVANEGVDPAQHFVSVGWAEGRWPNPVFDTEWYLFSNPDIELSGINPLTHYSQKGWREGRNPHPLFSTSYYLESNPDVAAAGLNPLEHYLKSGHLEPRDPHPLFQSGRYLAENPDVAAAGVNPLAHYLHYGWREGRRANPIFDPDWYKKHIKLLPDQEPLTHYTAGGAATARISPHAMFDGAWYLDRYADVAEAGLNPLVHYLHKGGFELRDPGPGFDTQSYLRRTPEASDSGMVPLAHFLVSPRNNETTTPLQVQTPTAPAEKKQPPLPHFPDLFTLRASKTYCDRVLIVRVGSLSDARRTRDFVVLCAAKADIIIAFNRKLRRDQVEDAIGASLAIFVDYTDETENGQVLLDLINNGAVGRYRSTGFCDARRVGDAALDELCHWSESGEPDTFVWTRCISSSAEVRGSDQATARILRARLGRKLNKAQKLTIDMSAVTVPGFLANEVRAMNVSTSDLRRFGTIEHALPILIASIAADSEIDIVEEIPAKRTDTPSETPSTKVIAFYLPQYHPIPENDAWWGTGFTEWTNTAKSRPLFRHHHQPQLPADLGFYDLRLPETQSAQAELARKFGVHGFCYYYYWFDGKKVLNQPIEQMMESGQPDLPYCICWANENWSRNWDGQNRHVLLKQSYSVESNRDLIREFIKHFEDGRYIRFDNKPVLIVYRIRIIPNWRETAEMWREECRAAGIGEIYLCAVRFGLEPLDGQPSEFGLDAYVLFPPHETVRTDARQSVLDLVGGFNGEILDYDAAVEGDLKRFENGYPWPVHRGAMLGWDNTARRQRDARIFVGSTPSRLRAWLSGIVEQNARHSNASENLVFVNAWNEWAEGTMLEPSQKFGSGYLQALQSAVRPNQEAEPATPPGSTDLISRVDPKWYQGSQAHVHGAPTVLLCAHVVSNQLFGGERSFIDILDALSALPVNIIVALPSDAHPDYTKAMLKRAKSVVIVPYRQWRSNRLADPGIVAAFEHIIRQAGIDCVYANTIVLMEPVLAGKKLRVPAIIHARELIDEDQQLTESIGLPADEIIDRVHAISDYVIANSEKTYQLYYRPLKTFKAPNVVCGTSLDIPNHVSSGSPIFGIVSSNLPKKGVPEFIEVARQALLKSLGARFVVVGPENQFTEIWKKSDLPANVEFLGYRGSPKEAMQELNVLLSLSTFAESFGRTVAEAQAARRPVIAFAHGAVPELVQNNETGFLVSPGDLDAVTSHIEHLCRRPELIAVMGEEARSQMLRKFSPDTLRRNLLPPLRQAVDFNRPVPSDMLLRPATVIVPVYNAAAATRDCLRSIERNLDDACAQVIVIDDGSTDPEVGKVLAEYSGHDRFRILRNGKNIGYTGTINKGISLAGDNDVVLLNSDTIVTRSWLDGLRKAAYSCSNVATSTAMSDNAGAFSFPVENTPNSKPENVSHDDHALKILMHTSKHLPVQVPTGSGFCMFIRRDALDRLGTFDEETFPRGYGEENDFCMRAVRSGWTHVIAPAAYVFHVRTASFGAEKETLIKAAIDKVTTRYPEYAGLVKAAFGSDQMKALRIAAGIPSSEPNVVDASARLEISK